MARAGELERKAVAANGSAAVRVLFVVPEPFYQDRGTPIAARQVLEALSARGFAVDVVTYPLGETIELAGLRIARTANPFRFRSVAIGFSLRKVVLDVLLTAAVLRRLGRRRYDAIHALEEAAFPAVALGRRYRVPVIYDMHSSLPRQMEQHLVFRPPPVQWLLRRCERWLLRRADHIVCSAGLEGWVRAVAPRARVREWLFPSQAFEPVGEDAARLRARLRLDDGCAVVLYVGNFAPYQGIGRLIEAAVRLRRERPDAVLVLVGVERIADLPRARDAESLRAAGGLRLVPRCPRSAVAGYLAMADVLVSPRLDGGNLPLKVFDYMASGRPIVAVDDPTHRRLLDDDRAVMTAPTAAALADGIARALREPEHARRLGEAARRYAREHLGWEAFAERVARLYDDALGARNRDAEG